MPQISSRIGWLATGLIILGPLRAQAQEDSPVQAPAPTVFNHPETSRWWLSGQINIITQYHPRFRAPYSGVNSLRPEAEAATSYIATAFSGVRLTSTTEVFLDIESAAGGGISQALGVGGFTNLDVVRNPSLGSVPYIGRALVRQVVPLSQEGVAAQRGPHSLAPSLPTHRLEFRAGKFGTADYFDTNAVASDSHLQFMNWAIGNTGAYDYAADTRGYTLGVIGEYQSPWFGVRLGGMMMPTVANGIVYDTDLAAARAENLEIELRHGLIPGHIGTVRLLGFINHARMGSYAEANAAFLNGTDATPDITAHRHRGAIKYGGAINLEQEVTSSVRAFLRAGWNDGLNESFAYTEIDDTLGVGFDWRGNLWRRPQDKWGAAVVTNGISAGHREYLTLGGSGFLLGDGALRYGRETLIEAYYTALLFNGVSVAGDVQGIMNPGYNRDRGPVAAFSLRVHLEI